GGTPSSIPRSSGTRRCHVTHAVRHGRSLGLAAVRSQARTLIPRSARGLPIQSSTGSGPALDTCLTGVRCPKRRRGECCGNGGGGGRIRVAVKCVCRGHGAGGAVGRGKGTHVVTFDLGLTGVATRSVCVAHCHAELSTP